MEENKPVENIPWTILGRECGTATGWDQQDAFEVTLYDFMPYEKFGKLPRGDITIDFINGSARTYDNEGNIVTSTDLVSALNG